MACEKLGPKLTDYHFGELSPRERRIVSEHLEGCPGCRAELESIEAAASLASEALCLDAVAEDELRLSPERRSSIRAAAETRRPVLSAGSFWARFAPSPFQLGWMASLALVLVFVLPLGTTMFTRTESPKSLSPSLTKQILSPKAMASSPGSAEAVEIGTKDAASPAVRWKETDVLDDGDRMPVAPRKTGRTALASARKGFAKGDEKAALRRPRRLTFVIDVSESMKRKGRLELVKTSLKNLLPSLEDEDSISIVTYGSTSRVDLPHGSLAEPSRILSLIDGMTAGGSSRLEEGLALAYAEASKAYLAGGINRILLCSDGIANVGPHGPESILELAADGAKKGILLSTTGLIMGSYNDVLMEQLARRGHGDYAYVNDLEEARDRFVEMLAPPHAEE